MNVRYQAPINGGDEERCADNVRAGSTREIAGLPVPFFLLFVLLALPLAACSLPTRSTGSTLDEEELVRRAVATISAQQAAEIAVTMNGELEATLISLYDRVSPSVVYITTYFGTTELSSGSGFVYDNAGHIITNNHVVGNGDSFEVIFRNGVHLPGEVVGADADSDLAIIRLEELPAGVIPLPLSDFDQVRVGQFVAAIGSPFGEQGSISLGIISGLGRRIRSQRDTPDGIFSLPEVIQTDAPINPGNSGGPLLNMRGEVVGVNSAIRTDTGVNSGVGFAIPVHAVQRIVPALITKGRYSYPYLGITALPVELDLSLQRELNLPQSTGVYITGITQGGPADTAGLLPATVGNGPMGAGPGGDLIIGVDEQAVQDFHDLISYLVFETEVGQIVQLTILREGETVTVPVTLSERP